MLIDYRFIPFLGTGLFLLFAAFLFLYIMKSKLKESKKEKEFENQIKYSANVEEDTKSRQSPLLTKIKNLPQEIIRAEIVPPTVHPKDVNRKLMFILATIFLIGVIITKNPVGGIMLTLITYILIHVFVTFKINGKKNLINEQIPAFVAVFKANIQSNQHPQNAMINAINNTASPLYDELVLAKSIMEAGDFKPGIASIRLNAQNETLKQLASCIELASASGSSIEEQIEIIEEIIADKQEIERKKKLGVHQNAPLFIVAALVLPISFLATYFSSEIHRAYWFSTFNSYLILSGVVLLSLFSVFMTVKVIKKIDIG